MKAMLDWIDRRTGFLGCLRECADRLEGEEDVPREKAAVVEG